VIRISHSSQITLLQLGHAPDAYLLVPHISHSTLVSEMRFASSTLFIMSLPSYNVSAEQARLMPLHLILEIPVLVIEEPVQY